MSLLIKIRNLLYIIRIFYWLAFKAVVKATYAGNLYKYPSSYLVRTTYGPSIHGNFCVSEYSNTGIRMKYARRRRSSSPTIARRLTSGCMASSLKINAIFSRGTITFTKNAGWSGLFCIWTHIPQSNMVL
jgi:hypothetical protein